MKEYIWRRFIKDHENVKDPAVRRRYTRLTGITGIIVNSILCVIKILLGAGIHSIAVIADGVHDLADSLAACITLAGAYIAGKPADKDHPYGHARAEYLASLVVSAIILVVGFELLRSSIDKCRSPEPTEFSWLMVGFMVFAILFKGSSALFTIATGKRINSLPVIAAGTDNRNDCITSVIIVIGMLIHHFLGFELDGYMGCLVSLFILYSGIMLIRETVNPLLGAPPERETVEGMVRIIRSHPEVLGVHDLIVYSYGPGKTFATFHAEVDSRSDMIEIHDVIDEIEVEIADAMDIIATCHMDPVEVDNPIRLRMQEVIAEEMKLHDEITGFHDLRIVPGKTATKIVFDVVTTPEGIKKRDELLSAMNEAVKRSDPSYEAVINFDQDYC